MKPSQYTFIVVPDHDGKNRQFSISRKGTLILIFSIISLFVESIIIIISIFKKGIFKKEILSKETNLGFDLIIKRK